MADECKAIIGYTSYPNERFNLSSEADYHNISSKIWQAAHECDNTDEVIAGACRIVYPRCLMGYSLELCRQSCLGKNPNEDVPFIMYIVVGASNRLIVLRHARAPVLIISVGLTRGFRRRSREVLWPAEAVFGVSV